MQNWYKAGRLPPELPVRRDTDSDYLLLGQLRLRALDPNRPFHSISPTPSTSDEPLPVSSPPTPTPLLSPISLLAQPKHFGPPALFFSSRGGHSTTIVDARGRSVLKGRFLWSPDEENDDEQPTFLGKLGDVKRVEAFDVRDRAVIVALRQGGLEAADVGDALHAPADESRAWVPNYQSPPSGIGRRGPYVWRIGGPLGLPPAVTPIASDFTRDSGSRSATKKHHDIRPRSSGKADLQTGADDTEYNGQEEVLFLGRHDDEMYLCERGAGTFRILKLSPS